MRDSITFVNTFLAFVKSKLHHLLIYIGNLKIMVNNDDKELIITVNI